MSSGDNKSLATLLTHECCACPLQVVGGKKGVGPARKRRVLEQSLSLRNGHMAGVARSVL